MKLALLLSLLTASALIAGVAITQRKPVGRCMPYAEKCLHCSDCSTCKHCSVSKGFCSVCK
jgi:hypothetical protein